MANIFRSIVQTAWDVAQGALTNTVDGTIMASDHPSHVKVNAATSDLLSQGWKEKYAALFREIKVHKIEAWYMPYAQLTDPGVYTFTVCDFGESTVVDQEGMVNIGGPGTIVRRMNQTAYRVWYPTEPSDREWQPINEEHKWLTYAISSAESKYWVHTNNATQGNVEVQHTASLAGKVIINVHASFRGTGDGKVKITAMPCTCMKCSRISKREVQTMGFENMS